jgi:enoyl-CoA hydratase/carnithine racemase
MKHLGDTAGASTVTPLVLTSTPSARRTLAADEPAQGWLEWLDMSQAGEVVRLEVAGGVGTIRIDRPRMNALSADMQRRIKVAAQECGSRSDIAAVVITGGDQVFAAGADIKEMAGLSYAEMVSHSTVLQAAFSAVARIPKPVVAAVNGYALGGGCELALCADIRIAADDATFGQPEIKLGVIPGAGGTQRLARLVGPSRAKEIIFTGRFVPAAEALAIGLVDRVVPAADVLATATAWAGQFVGGPSLALRAAKECIDFGSGVDLETGLQMERQQFAALFATEDRAIGMTSFVEQGPGKAEFRGR